MISIDESQSSEQVGCGPKIYLILLKIHTKKKREAFVNALSEVNCAMLTSELVNKKARNVYSPLWYMLTTIILLNHAEHPLH